MDKTESKNNFLEKTIPFISELYNYALLLTADYADAEKLVFKTYRNAHSFYKFLSQKTEIRLWLFRIINNLEIKSTTDQFNPVELSQKKLQMTVDECDVRLSQLSSAKILRGISSMPESLKKIIALIQSPNLQIEQVAELLDVPIGTVYKRLFDARDILIKNLCEELTTPVGLDDKILTYQEKREIATLVEEEKIIPDESDFVNEIKRQLLVKQILAGKIVTEKPTPELEEKILSKFSSTFEERIRNKSRSARSKRLVSYITFSTLIVLIILFLINKPSLHSYKNFAVEQTGNNNLLIQFQNTFKQYRTNKFNNFIFEGNRQNILSYLNKDSSFDGRHLYKNDNLTLAGCFFNGNSGLHFIYKDKNHRKILMRQISIRELKHKGNFTLTNDLLKFLLAGNCYSTVKNGYISLLKSDGNNIFVFGTNGAAKELILEICKQKKE